MDNLAVLFDVFAVGAVGGVFLAVIAAGIAVGWRYAPWIIVAACVFYLLG